MTAYAFSGQDITRTYYAADGSVLPVHFRAESASPEDGELTMAMLTHPFDASLFQYVTVPNDRATPGNLLRAYYDGSYGLFFFDETAYATVNDGVPEHVTTDWVRYVAKDVSLTGRYMVEEGGVARLAVEQMGAMERFFHEMMSYQATAGQSLIEATMREDNSIYAESLGIMVDRFGFGSVFNADLPPEARYAMLSALVNEGVLGAESAHALWVVMEDSIRDMGRSNYNAQALAGQGQLYSRSFEPMPGMTEDMARAVLMASDASVSLQADSMVQPPLPSAQPSLGV